MSDPEQLRTEQLQNLAYGLGNYLRQLQANELDQAVNSSVQPETAEKVLSSPEEWSGPDGYFFTDLYMLAGEFSYFAPSPDGTIQWYDYLPAEIELDLDVVDFHYFIGRLAWEKATETKWGDELREKVEATERLDYMTALEIDYASLSWAREKLGSSQATPLDKADALLISGYLAALYLREGFDKPGKVKKHKNETEEEIRFRKAIFNLYYAFDLRKTHDYLLFSKKFIAPHSDNPSGEGISEEWFDDLRATLTNPDNSSLRNGLLSFKLCDMACHILERLASPEFTPASFREELGKLRELKQHENEPNSLVPITETHWTVLPPGDLEIISQGGTSTGEGVDNFVDMERLNKLARLAIGWGPDSYIAVANLQASGGYDYQVAVLPQNIDGVLVEHAVAENPSSGNAVYIFRGERGLETGGKVWLTWKKVLSATKAAARQLGARKIKHTPNVDKNVLEYLTRHPDKLDKPGYQL